MYAFHNYTFCSASITSIEGSGFAGEVFNEWRVSMQCCCPRGKSLSSRIPEDQFSSPCHCPCPRKFKSSKIFEDWVGERSMWNIKHHRLAVTEWRMGGLFAIVPQSGCRSHRTALQQCVVLDESPCPRRSSRTNFQVLVLGHQVLVLVLLEAWLLVLVLVLESQVLDNNTVCMSVRLYVYSGQQVCYHRVTAHSS